MAIKWNPDFDRKEHKDSVASPQVRQSLMQKSGAVKYVKQVKRPSVKPVGGKSRWDLNREARAVSRDFVFPGALVRIVKSEQVYFGGHSFCTVIAEYDRGATGAESVTWGKYWECMLPDGKIAFVNSRAMRPLSEVQNGNVEDDEGSVQDPES